jgi:hypothetical protein
MEGYQTTEGIEPRLQGPKHYVSGRVMPGPNPILVAKLLLERSR